MPELAPCRVRAYRAAHSWDGRIWQFRDLDFTVHPGEVMAILGPNGRGKSTLLRVAAGLLHPDGGRVEITGSAGLVPQDFARPFPYRVLDMVLMGRARHIGLLRMPGRHDRAAALAALEVIGMAHKARHRFDELSGGERQLVLIARAIAGEPAILLLDEPAAALDLRNQDRVLSLMRRLADEGLSVIFTTHQPNHCLAVADSALLMLPDATVIFGETHAVLTDRQLTRLYGLPVRMVEIRDRARRHQAMVPLFSAVSARSGTPEQPSEFSDPAPA
ncbi:ABC transporter ATP-binding protein [Tropicimonas sp.]|uniref:ABC transporter ATP-binding protein n=1 Tax=Tropicimonas sp. TaxID=2067044 RepID=UPI003A8AE7DC